MRYNGRLLMVPWLGVDEDGLETKNWSRLRFNGAIDSRRLKREVRRAVNKLLERKVHPQELRNLLRHSLPLHATD